MRSRTELIAEIKKDRSVCGWDLRDVDLSNLDLAGVDFRDCDLRGTDFSFANISNAAFAGAAISSMTTWKGAEFSGGEMKDIRFVGHLEA